MGTPMKTVKKFDYDGLKMYLDNHEIRYSDLSVKLGYSNCYISNLITKQMTITETTYKLLCLTLNVPDDTFIKKNTPKANVEKQNVSTGSASITIDEQQWAQYMRALSAQNSMLAQLSDEIRNVKDEFHKFAEYMGVKPDVKVEVID